MADRDTWVDTRVVRFTDGLEITVMRTSDGDITFDVSPKAGLLCLQDVTHPQEGGAQIQLTRR
jgi:hypothetical protein